MADGTIEKPEIEKTTSEKDESVDDSKILDIHIPLKEAMKYLETTDYDELYTVFSKILLKKMAEKKLEFPSDVPLWYSMVKVYNRREHYIEFKPNLTEKDAIEYLRSYQAWEGKWGEEQIYRVSNPETERNIYFSKSTGSFKINE